ncbi:MAG TPA: hypothetical protein VK890_04695 [Bacteroidia bacterium]|nr:hypothetical protein [Bacteroidia bacterium]
MKKSTLFPVSLVILVAGIMLACAGGEDDSPSSFFTPEVTHSGKYSIFFRSDLPLYIGRKYDYTSDFVNININEWSGYFLNKINQKDLSYILYNARLGEIDTLIFSIKKPGYPISSKLKENSVLKVTDTRSALDFLYYAGFARRCEKYSTYTNPYWYDDASKDTNNPRKDKDGMAKLANGGIKQIGNANSDFVRQRYAFQVLRLYYMSCNYDKCIQFYTDQKKILESSNNTIKYRSMGYLAGAYYKNKQYGNANYLYSLVYDGCDTMKIAAYFSFHPQEEKDWLQTMAMAKNTREKTVLWQMLGIYNDPLRAMDEIYTLDPKSDLLDLLLARAVNIQDESTPNKDLFSFIKTIADKGNTAKPYEWDLATGYLGYANDNKDFQKYLNKAKSEATGDALVLEQVRLIELLAKVYHAKAGDKKFEESVVPELKWLKGSHPRDFRSEDAYKWAINIIAMKYDSAGNEVIATCFKHWYYDSYVYGDSALNELKAFIDKKNKTAFEEYGLSELSSSKASILEIQAVGLLDHYDFKGALSRFNEDADAGKGELYGDPFVIHINDCHDCDAADKNKTKYTEKEFTQKMIDLENKAIKEPKNAENYFTLANAFYNMSYYGNNRALCGSPENYIPGSTGKDDRNANGSATYYGTNYIYSCDSAMAFYLKAMNASRDPEFKAKCCFMAAKCEQNQFYEDKPSNYPGDFKAGDYFAMMQSTYSNTKYYQEVIKECGYFKTYVNK